MQQFKSENLKAKMAKTFKILAYGKGYLAKIGYKWILFLKRPQFRAKIFGSCPELDKRQIF
jgi:hypothetical protein